MLKPPLSRALHGSEYAPLELTSALSPCPWNSGIVGPIERPPRQSDNLNRALGVKRALAQFRALNPNCFCRGLWLQQSVPDLHDSNLQKILQIDHRLTYSSLDYTKTSSKPPALSAALQLLESNPISPTASGRIAVKDVPRRRTDHPTK
ncbi:hypothetical protein DPX16_20058 [Anabarilius grahami]|uniref:Uncharacterized protein n=1 Tax=Anabarilius grahami TaxID=495550 RepID=A0A3N0XSY8_ANAGA|nr:hypothetical protein DPX16_20058 [Anabarilius grahami]